jgi:SAM-dependent methyltransferase
MDRTTLAAYNDAATAFAEDWHAQPPPSDLHALIRHYFRPGPTADIGCGSGREVAWLAANGFTAIGYDASEGLLFEARTRYPQHSFEVAALPELAPIADDSFDNVLCETVIMHLTCEAIAPALQRMMAILKPGGVLYVSWRVTEGTDQRDASGRLYAAFDSGLVAAQLAGASILLDEEAVSVSSAKRVHRIVARKPWTRSL